MPLPLATADDLHTRVAAAAFDNRGVIAAVNGKELRLWQLQPSGLKSQGKLTLAEEFDGELCLSWHGTQLLLGGSHNGDTGGCVLVDGRNPAAPAVIAQSTRDVQRNVSFLHHGFVYVGYAPSRDPGRPGVWRHPVQEPDLATQFLKFDEQVSFIAGHGDQLYVVADCSLVAFDIASKPKRLWRKELDSLPQGMVLSGDGTVILLVDVSPPLTTFQCMGGKATNKRTLLDDEGTGGALFVDPAGGRWLSLSNDREEVSLLKLSPSSKGVVTDVRAGLGSLGEESVRAIGDQEGRPLVLLSNGKLLCP